MKPRLLPRLQSGRVRVVVALPGSSTLEGLWDKKGEAASSPVPVPYLLQNGDMYWKASAVTTRAR